ncbi:MAG: HAMP domain-containing protein [Ignavibacteriales bacterium]|nr:HAMP domain-containing protein [Ignavibacteriales bacterium]
MKKLFNNLSIKKKILAGFSVILILLGLVGVIAYSTIVNSNAGFSDFSRKSNNSNSIGRVQANLLEARLAVKNFIQTNNDIYAKEFRERFSKLHEFIDEAKKGIQDSERNSRIVKVDNLSTEYEHAFKEVESLIAERNEIFKKILNVYGVDIVNSQLIPLMNASNVNGSMALKHMLLARIYVMKFLEDNSEESAKRVNEEFSNTAEYLNKLGNSSIIATFDKYSNGFNKIVEVINKRNEIVKNKLDSIGPEIAAISEELKLEIIKSEKELEEQLVAKNNQANVLILIIGLLSILFGIIVAIFMANIITKPILTVAERVDQLQSVCITNLGVGLDKMAKGELNVNVEKATKHLNFDQKDEIGEMARTIDKMITKAQGGIDSYEIVRTKIKNLSAEADKLINDAKNGKLNNRGDESIFEGAYKEIIGGFNDVLDAVILPVQDGTVVLEKMAEGDLTSRVEKDYKGDHQKIKNSINKLGDSLEDILTQITDAISATASAANQISSSAEELAAGSEEQSSQTSEVATAVEQMIATITQTAKHVVQTNESAKESGNLASEGKDVIESTINGMKKIEEVVKNSSKIIFELGESSTQISEIIQVINDIADQTNLLALNAAIEAARAGEQGRGFAVVADEVRKLAERTTKATNEIEEMITKIQSDSKNAVEAINRGNEEVGKGMEQASKAGDSMNKIVQSSNQVLEISTQVAAASEEQSTTVEQIGKSVDGINSVAHESASGVQQVAGAATDLSRLAENLQSLVSQFKLRNSEYSKYESESNYSVKSKSSLVNY